VTGNGQCPGGDCSEPTRCARNQNNLLHDCFSLSV
jgi:hypothetical protein